MSNFKVMRKMITLVAPLSGVMCIAVLMGVIGYLCAIFIPVLAVTIAAYLGSHSLDFNFISCIARYPALSGTGMQSLYCFQTACLDSR